MSTNNNNTKNNNANITDMLDDITDMLDDLSEEQLLSIAKQINVKTNEIKARNEKLNLINCANKRNELYIKFATDNSTELSRISEIDVLLTKQVSEWKEEKERLINDLKPKFNDMAETCYPYCKKLHYSKEDSDIPPPPTNPVTKKYGLCHWSRCEYCNEIIHGYDY